jgi:hypothetical protein
MSASAGGGNGNRRRGVFSLGKYRLPVVGSSTTSIQQQQQQHLIDSSSNSGGGGSRAVKYTPRGHPLQQQQQADTSLFHSSRDNGQHQDDELEEIAVVSVVSGVQSGQLTYGSAGSSMANGPRVVPGKKIKRPNLLILS